MRIISDKRETIFKKEINGRAFYSIALSKKDKDGNFVNGYMKVDLRKGADIPNKSRIKIKNAWLSFYKDEDNKTMPTLFIDEFEIVKEGEQNPYEEFGDSIKTKSDIGQQIEITDNDLPF